ncbi:WG repeat-containing protein [Acinetobacter sp. c1-l78]|uniref:WG repeat-containing protein n=1 Tax=Acinetobacter sp. c1-l78 TaxID=3342803 RepID=UPI0035B9020D
MNEKGQELKGQEEIENAAYLSSQGELGKLSEGLAMYCVKNKCGFIDKTGKEIIKRQYQKTAFNYNFRLGRNIVGKEDKMLLIDSSGNELTPLYDEILRLNEPLMRVAKNGKYGMINQDGKLVIPIIYDEIEYDMGWYNRASTYPRFSFYASDFVPPMFNGARFFDGDIALVKLNGEKIYINTQGQRVK